MFSRLSRRQILRGLGGTGLAATIAPSVLAACGSEDTNSRDDDTVERLIPEHRQVVVIGGGAAGLMAARQLAAAGVDVVVVEARQRVGGRTFNLAMLDGAAIEGGGMWVGPSQDAALGLAAELRIETFPTPTGGDVVRFHGGRVSVEPPARPAEVDAACDLVDAKAATLPVGRAWDAPDAAHLDAITFREWLTEQGVPADVSDRVIGTVEPAFGDPGDMSMLWLLAVAQSAGGMRKLVDIVGGANERRLDGGLAGLSVRMAEELGDRVVIGTPITKVEYEPDGGALVIAANRSWRADQVIVAMMPADVERITFHPALPPARAALQRQWIGRSAIKAIVIYDRPFWRAAGLSGIVIAESDPIADAFDITPPGRDDGWLVVFVNPGAITPDADPRDDVVTALVPVLGEQAAEPVAFHAYDWTTDPWASGCVSALRVGVLTELGSALRAPVGPIHWAGTETADVWIGYVDGAIRSGRRAAAEVLAVRQRS